jgi:hypothetical protein
MGNQQQSHFHQQPHQQNNHYHQRHQDRHHPGNAQEQRREFLWREQVKLEMQVHALLERANGLEQEWHMLQHRKAQAQQQKPKLAVQIVLSGLAGMRSLPAERLFQYERERLVQEEERLQQAKIRCQSDLVALQAQIAVIQLELSFLT